MSVCSDIDKIIVRKASMILNIAGVCLNGKWGFINEQGELICDLKFDSIAIWHSDMDGYSYEAYLGKKIYTLSRAGEFVERK